MEMHQVRYFLALSTDLNFTHAAKRCGVSQPSLTNAIAKLERELGGRLFQRKPQVMLTALGHSIWPHLNRVARGADNAHEAARKLVAVPNSSSVPLATVEQPGHPELRAAPDSEAAAAWLLAMSTVTDRAERT